MNIMESVFNDIILDLRHNFREVSVKECSEEPSHSTSTYEEFCARSDKYIISFTVVCTQYSQHFNIEHTYHIEIRESKYDCWVLKFRDVEDDRVFELMDLISRRYDRKTGSFFKDYYPEKREFEASKVYVE